MSEEDHAFKAATASKNSFVAWLESIGWTDLAWRVMSMAWNIIQVLFPTPDF
jgi:hypothetical protein